MELIIEAMKDFIDDIKAEISVGYFWLRCELWTLIVLNNKTLGVQRSIIVIKLLKYHSVDILDVIFVLCWLKCL